METSHRWGNPRNFFVETLICPSRSTTMITKWWLWRGKLKNWRPSSMTWRIKSPGWIENMRSRWIATGRTSTGKGKSASCWGWASKRTKIGQLNCLSEGNRCQGGCVGVQTAKALLVRNVQKFRSFHPISLIFLNLGSVILFRSPLLCWHSHSFTFIFFSYDFTDLKQSTWPDKAVYGATLSVAKDTGQTNPTLQPHHILDQDPHPSPNTPNPEDSLLDLQDKPADGPFNLLLPQLNLRLVQACSNRRSQQRSTPASTRTSALNL